MQKDLLSGAVLLGVAAIYYAWSSEIADSTLSDEVGAAGLPQALAAVLAILGVLLVGRTLLAARAQRTSDTDAGDDEHSNAALPRAIGFL